MRFAYAIFAHNVFYLNNIMVNPIYLMLDISVFVADILTSVAQFRALFQLTFKCIKISFSCVQTNEDFRLKFRQGKH